MNPTSGRKGGGKGSNMPAGLFNMNGGGIKNNINSLDYGGGVQVKNGTFTMNNGVISGNMVTIHYGNGGGVLVNSGGTFIMNGGVISGNQAASGGGGVCVESSGVFTKSGSGGVIYGSNAPEGQANRASKNNAHAVWVLFAHNSALIRNTTARISQALDSRVRGAAGGWE